MIRVLLNKPEGSLTKYKLAKEAETSFPWTHEFLNKLEAKKLVKGTQVTDYSGLIHYWLTVKAQPERREYMHKDPIILIRKTNLPYALTTYQAENLVQHYLFPSRTDLYISPKHAEQWHNELTAEGLAGKGNVRLLMADSHVFYGASKLQGLTVVSTPQLIVDLLEEGGVCTEAAEKLLKKVEEHAVPAH